MRTLRLNNNIDVFYRPEESECVFVRRGTGQQYEFELDQSGREVLTRLRESGGILNPASLSDSGVEIAEDLFGLELLTVEEIPDLQHPYRSQLEAFRNWRLDPIASQEKISRMRVGLIGAGGLGGWLALELAAMGFRNFVLVDSDRVDATNLVRQPFNRQDIGRYKVDCLVDALNLRFEGIQATRFYKMAGPESPYNEWFKECDFVLIAGDYPSRSDLSSIVSKWCMESRKIHLICGGYSGHNSAMGITVIPGATPCWSCYEKFYYSQQPDLVRPENKFLNGPANPAGIVPTVMIAASASAYEVLRLAVGMPPQFSGKSIDFHADHWALEEKPFLPFPDCSHCRHLLQEVSRPDTVNSQVVQGIRS